MITVTASVEQAWPRPCNNRHVPLHPQAEALLAMMAALDEPPLEQCTPAEAREIRARRLRPSSEPIHSSRDLDAGGVPARLYRPSDGEDLGLLVFFHGGGWVLGNMETHDNLYARSGGRGTSDSLALVFASTN